MVRTNHALKKPGLGSNERNYNKGKRRGLLSKPRSREHSMATKLEKGVLRFERKKGRGKRFPVTNQGLKWARKKINLNQTPLLSLPTAKWPVGAGKNPFFLGLGTPHLAGTKKKGQHPRKLCRPNSERLPKSSGGTKKPERDHSWESPPSLHDRFLACNGLPRVHPVGLICLQKDSQTKKKKKKPGISMQGS